MIVLALSLLLRLRHPGILFSLSSAQFSFLLFFNSCGVVLLLLTMAGGVVAHAHLSSMILILGQIVSIMGYADGCDHARLCIYVERAVDLRVAGRRQPLIDILTCVP